MASSVPQVTSTGPAPATGPNAPAPSDRVLRPRTKIISHKNTCGAPAPATTLGKRSRPSTRARDKPLKKEKNQPKKVATSDKANLQNFLKVTLKGDRLDAVSV